MDFEFAVFGYRNFAGLFADNYAKSVGYLGHSECCTVAQAEAFWNVHVVAYGQDASGSCDFVLGDYHCAVVKW